MPSLPDALSQSVPIFTDLAGSEFMRYILAAAGLHVLLNTVLKPVVTRRKIRPAWPPKGQIRREILYSARSVLVFATLSLGAVWAVKAGWTQVYRQPDALGWLYFAVSVAVLIIGHDTWFYWMHRLLHDRRLYRNWHHLHHRSFNPTPFTAFAFNIGEAFLHGLYTPLLILVLPVSYLALFTFSVHMILRNTMGHCGVELFPATRSGRPLFGWLTTVTHHDIHHASPGWNYGLYFTFWDRVMKTEHPDYLEKFAEAVRAKPKGLGKRAVVSTVMAAALACGVTSGGLPGAGRAEAASADLGSVSGRWVTEGYGAVVRLQPCAKTPVELCGRLEWIWDPALKSHLGKDLMWGFRQKGAEWRDGEITIPGKNQVFRSTIRVVDRNVLKVRGCALVVCHKQTWRRLESLPHVGMTR